MSAHRPQESTTRDHCDNQIARGGEPPLTKTLAQTLKIPQFLALKLRYQVLNIDRNDADTFDYHIRLVGRMLPDVLSLKGQRYTGDMSAHISGERQGDDSEVTYAAANTIQTLWSMDFVNREDMMEHATDKLLEVLPQRFKLMVDTASPRRPEPTSVANHYAVKAQPHDGQPEPARVYTLTTKKRKIFLENCIKEVFLAMKKGEAAHSRLQEEEDSRHNSINAIGVTASKNATFHRAHPNQGSSGSFLSSEATPSGEKRGRPRKDAARPAPDVGRVEKEKKHLDRLLEIKQCIFELGYASANAEEQAEKYQHVQATEFTNPYAVSPEAISGCTIEELTQMGTTIQAGRGKQRLSYTASRTLIKERGMGDEDVGHTYIKYRRDPVSGVQKLLVDDDEKLAKALILAQKTKTEHADEVMRMFFSPRAAEVELEERACPALATSVMDG